VHSLATGINTMWMVSTAVQTFHATLFSSHVSDHLASLSYKEVFFKIQMHY